jgi:medium-chain acyl-[acyl-carrier-protein] hydrolase
MRLYCFPYAGGNAAVFESWQARLDPSIEVCAIQLPGRGARFNEAPCTAMATVVTALAEAILAQDRLPFAFFGHSLGALLAFELTRYLKQRYLPAPLHLFVSGCAAPQHRDAPKNLHRLPDDDLIAALRDYQGTPPEVLAHSELMQLLLPMVRADFQLAETYQYRASLKFDTPLTVFAGRQDDRVSEEQVTGWQKETVPTIRVQWCEGGHFFIHGARDLVLDCLNAELAAVQAV